MTIRNGKQNPGVALLACMVLALGAGCGGGKESEAPSASDTEVPAIPAGVREMMGAAAEAEGVDADLVAIMKSEKGLAQLSEISTEISLRSMEATMAGDMRTPEGRAEAADKLDALVTDIRARIPDLDPTVQNKITEMIDDVAEMAADMRTRD